MLTKILKPFKRFLNIFNGSQVTTEKLTDTFRLFTCISYLSILGGIFGLLALTAGLLGLTKESSLLSFLWPLFPILIIIFSMALFVYSKNRTDGIAVALAANGVIAEMYKIRDELFGTTDESTDEDDENEDESFNQDEKLYN